MTKEYSITYDFGTGSVKAALIDNNHDVLSWASVAYTTYYPAPEIVTQKVEDYWDCFCNITKKLIREAGVSGEDIKGIAISQTTSTVIFVDENNQHMNDCVVWLDNRGVKQAFELNEKAGKEWTQGKRVPAKLLWYKQNQPEIIEKAKYMLDVSAYFYLRLTGETGWDITAANATDMTIDQTKEWEDWKFDCIGIRHDLLPRRVVDSFDKIGEMLPGVAEEAGFVTGTPIFGGCSDNANGHIGAGCIRPGDAHMYMGSSGWISVSCETPLYVRNVMQSAVPGIGYDYYCTDSTGTAIDYMIRQFYKEEASELGDGIYKLIANDAMSVESDNEQTLFLPFMYGEEEPVLDPAVRGSLLNIKATTERAHIIRAVMEGTAFNFRWIKENLVKQDAWNINFMRAIGGGVQNDVHLQIMADIIEEPLIRLKNCRVAGNIGLTACIDIGLGEAKDYTILDEYIKEEKTFYPRAEFAERYAYFFELFKKSYYALQDIYDTLNL